MKFLNFYSNIIKLFYFILLYYIIMNLRKIKNQVIPDNYKSKYLKNKKSRTKTKKAKKAKKASGLRNSRTRNSQTRNSRTRNSRKCGMQTNNLGDMILKLFS
jgi:hypothetical protein